MKKTPAQIILVIVALMLIIEPLADGWLGLGMLVDLHIGSSSLWPDHAKFHVIRQAIATILTGLLCAWGLLKYWDYGKGVRWTFALIPFLVNASAVIAINLSPILGVPNPVLRQQDVVRTKDADPGLTGIPDVALRHLDIRT